MSNNILKCFNIKNRNIVFGVILSLLTSLSVANPQNDLKLSSDAQATLEFFNSPQNKNDNINNPQTQNDIELVMFIMKSVEDKNLADKNKKIEFINSFKVSNVIKEQAISYINQNIKYSDNEKVSYGIYLLKTCNVSPKINDCRVDYKPTSRGCVGERSNICCQ